MKQIGTMGDWRRALASAGLAMLVATSIAVIPAQAAGKAPKKLDSTTSKATTEKTEKAESASTKKASSSNSDKATVSKGEKQLLEHINAEREKAGAGSLTFNVTLQKVAHIRGDEIVESFSHTRPDGTMYHTAFVEVGQEEKYFSAENLSAGRNDPQKVCQGWMESKGHKANMLNPIYTSVGIKHVSCDDPDAKYDDYWVIVFQGEGN